jgi:hypothetical protein
LCKSWKISTMLPQARGIFMYRHEIKDRITK